MLFGQSVFQSVLDRLDAEDDTAPAAPAAHRIQGLNSGFASTVLEGVSAASARPDQAYVDNMEAGFETGEPSAETGRDAPGQPAGATREKEKPPREPAAPAAPRTSTPPVEPPPVMPAHLARLAPADVAAELAITSKDTLQSLGDKRRAFARANHPDAMPAAFRDNATARMKIANLLIDEAIRRIGQQASRRR